MKSRRVGRTDGPLGAARRSALDDMAERGGGVDETTPPAAAASAAQLQRSTTASPGPGEEMASRSGGLPRRFWSTTSVLDMATAYSRSVMPCLLTEKEERMLDDVEEEDSDWNGSDCESGSDLHSCSEEEEEDAEEEEESMELGSSNIPISSSLPALDSDFLRHRSATLPPNCGRTDGGLMSEVLNGRRRTSRLLRDENLRQQLFQDKPDGSPALYRHNSVECLPSVTVDRSTTVDGSSAKGSQSRVTVQRHTIIGFDLPVWCAQSSGPRNELKRQSAVSINSTATTQDTLPPLLASAKGSSADCDDDSIAGSGQHAFQDRKLIGGRLNSQRKSYLLATEHVEPIVKASKHHNLVKKFRQKLLSRPDQKSSRSSKQRGTKEQQLSPSNSSDRLSRCESRNSDVFGSSTERPDDFVLTSSERHSSSSESRRRLSSVPGVNTLNRMRLKIAGRSKISTSNSQMDMDHSATDESTTSVTSSCASSPMVEHVPGLESGRRGSNLMQRIASPILVRRWKLNGTTSLDRRNSSSVPSHLNRCITPSPEPPVRPFFQTFLDIEARHIAEELTLLDSERLQSLQPSEFANGAWMGKERYALAPNIMTMVEHFNKLALITTKEVLTPPTAEKRAKAIGHFVDVAEECLKLQNFNSLKAILAGLQCTPMFRLTRTWKELSQKKNRKFLDLAELMAETKNYSEYRKRMKEALNNPPCVPFLGVFLTEIVQMDSFNKLHKPRRGSRRISFKGRRMSRRTSKTRTSMDGGVAGRRQSRKRSSNAVRHHEIQRLRESVESQTKMEEQNPEGDEAKKCVGESQAHESPSNVQEATVRSDRIGSISEHSECSQSHSCSLDRVSNPLSDPTSNDGVHHSQTELNSSNKQTLAGREAGEVTDSVPSTLSSPLSSHHRGHDVSDTDRDSAYNSDYSSRGGSATFSPQAEGSTDVSDDLATTPSSYNHSTERISPLAEPEPRPNHLREPLSSEKAAIGSLDADTELTKPELLRDDSPNLEANACGRKTPSTPAVENSETTDSTDGLVSRATETLKRRVKDPQQSPSSTPPLLRNSSSSQLKDRFASAVGNIVSSPRARKKLPSLTSVSHGGSNSLTKQGLPSPQISSAQVPGDVSVSVSADDQVPDKVSAERPESISCQVSPHMPLEEQLRRYKLAASHYHHASKPWVAYLLKNFECNTEEENYTLSCDREPKQDERKRWTILNRILSTQ